MKPYVYVLDKDGNPMMPTQRFGWVRRALKSGKAVVVKTIPFTIRLTYETETHVVQPIRVGIDPGRTNIGVAAVVVDDCSKENDEGSSTSRPTGKCVFQAKVETRNKEIPKLMQKRRMHRQASRRGERLARKRLAKKYETTMDASLVRSLPGYKTGTVTVKDIINTEAKFNNRRRPVGWLTPTVTQLLRTHEHVIEMVCKILPVSEVTVELNKFDFQLMENPNIQKWQYCKGPMHGHTTDAEALAELQDGVCLLCRKAPIEHVHHLIPRERNGSDTLANKAGLCRKCHTKVHTDLKAAENLSEKKDGINKKYGALSCVNQMIPFFVEWVGERFPGHAYTVQGYDTKQYRERFNLVKDHNVDAYCIAMTSLCDGDILVYPDLNMPECHFVKQFRCHDRARVKAQLYRKYKLGKDVVAENRHPACEAVVLKNGKVVERGQKADALDVWYEKMVKKHGEKEAMRMRSKLKAEKSYRRYNDMNRILPGAIIIYQGKRYVKSGQLTNGQYFRVVGDEKTNIPASDCQVYCATGLVFVS